MPQEQLKSSFEQVSVNNLSEQLPSAEQVTEAVSAEDAIMPSQPTVDTATASQSTVVHTQPSKLTARQEAIDDILEDGLADIYGSLSPDQQQKLRQSGEQTVRQIDQLLNHAKSQLGKIIGLIRRFLLIIPGVNRFFLEQEVKIKTDKIMTLKDK